MGTAWKIDWDVRIIYISHELSSAELLSLIKILTEDERGLVQGPLERWTIVTVGESN